MTVSLTPAIWNISGDAAALAIAATAAAAIAAITAQARLRSQLRHDFEVRERDATRAAVDAAVEVIIRTNNDLGEFAGRVIHLEEVRAEVERVQPEKTPSWMSDDDWELGERLANAQRAVNEQRDPADRATYDGLAARFRLQLRLGDHHPLVTTFAAWHESARAWFEVVGQGGSQSRSPAQLKESERLGEQVRTTLQEFVRAAQRWVQSLESIRERRYLRRIGLFR